MSLQINQMFTGLF